MRVKILACCFSLGSAISMFSGYNIFLGLQVALDIRILL